MKNKNLESKLFKIGEMMDLGKDEIKFTLKSRKNVIVTALLVAFAFVIVGSGWAYGVLRYGGSGIQDFIELGKFL